MMVMIIIKCRKEKMEKIGHHYRFSRDIIFLKNLMLHKARHSIADERDEGASHLQTRRFHFVDETLTMI